MCTTLHRTLRHAGFASALLLAATLAACGGDGGDGGAGGGDDTRSFAMGISTLPRELNAEAYADAFDLASDAGDLVLIQRAPPWEDFLPGGSVGAATADTTAAEIAAASEHDLELFYAIDPTDAATGRERLAGLPASHEGRTFGDPDVRSAFASYAEYVAINYKPAYLALGVQMNLYFRRNAADVEHFESLYDETYARVKAAHPETKVTLTFQYEDLQSLLPGEERHLTDWPLITRFEPRTDVTAISTYPSFAFAGADAIPANYYSQLTAFTDHPIVIAEAGFASATDADALNNGSEPDQQAFVRRLLREAEQLRMSAVVWFAGWDPAYAKGTPFAAFAHIGLLRADGSEKPAWPVWRAHAARRREEP